MSDTEDGLKLAHDTIAKAAAALGGVSPLSMQLAHAVIAAHRALKAEPHGIYPPDVPAHAIFEPKRGWLVDLDFPESFSMRVADAMWFPSSQVAHAAVKEAELPIAKHGVKYFVIRVQ